MIMTVILCYILALANTYLMVLLMVWDSNTKLEFGYILHSQTRLINLMVTQVYFVKITTTLEQFNSTYLNSTYNWKQ